MAPRLSCLALLAVLGVSNPASGQTPVLTRSYDNARSGANTSESILTPDKVSQRGMVRLRLPLPGDAAFDDPRIEAQPLYVPSLIMKDGKPHNVIFACSMANSVYAFDADTGHLIAPYPISLGPPVLQKNTSVLADVAFWGVNSRWGILGTPVIDPDTHLLYVINWTTEPDGQRVFHLNALDLATGQARLPAQAITAEAGEGADSTAFDPDMQKQRAALLLVPARQTGPLPVKKVLYMACGETQEGAEGHHGWLIAFDTDTLKPSASWCVTPKGRGGGIWQAGQGPSADARGDIYFLTSNGSFNGYISLRERISTALKAIANFDFHHMLTPLDPPTTDYSECFVKLHYSPPTANADDGRLDVLGWWCPFRDSDRHTIDGYDFDDQDLGSAGAVLPPGTNLVLGGGKDGILYTFDRDKLGNAFQAYSYLKQNPPPFVTYDPPPGKSSLGNLDFFGKDNKTHHLHGSPVVWNSPDKGYFLYVWGENESLRAWSLDGDSGHLSLLAKSAEVATAEGPHGGMPGGMLTLSANGSVSHTGIVWATTPIHEDSNRYVGGGILRAYDASQFDSTKNSDGTTRLKLLWDSARGSSGKGSLDAPELPFNFSKFCPPVVADGKVIVPTYDGHIDVYTLKNN